MSETEQLSTTREELRPQGDYSLRELQGPIHAAVLNRRFGTSRSVVRAGESQTAHDDLVTAQEYNLALKEVYGYTNEELRDALRKMGIEAPEMALGLDDAESDQESGEARPSDEPTSSTTRMGRLAKLLATLRNRSKKD